jgi:hypothetical protein
MSPAARIQSSDVSRVKHEALLGGVPICQPDASIDSRLPGIAQETNSEASLGMRDTTSYPGIYRAKVLGTDFVESVKLSKMVNARDPKIGLVQRSPGGSPHGLLATQNRSGHEGDTRVPSDADRASQPRNTLVRVNAGSEFGSIHGISIHPLGRQPRWTPQSSLDGVLPFQSRQDPDGADTALTAPDSRWLRSVRQPNANAYVPRRMLLSALRPERTCPARSGRACLAARSLSLGPGRTSGAGLIRPVGLAYDHICQLGQMLKVPP